MDIWELLSQGKKYLKDASPGGLLNPEVQQGAPTEVAKGLLGFTPGLGDAISGYDAIQAARQGNYGEAALNGLGVLPFIPAMGGILKRAHLKPDGPEFGQWELQKVEKRTRPEEYVDATGENRTRYVADMANAEQSWGSGQPVANIYWMKDKRTGEIKPFGDDTAHQAMGVSSSVAKQKFAEDWSKQQDAWLASEASKYGISTFSSQGRQIANIPDSRLREWLLKDQLSREEVASRLLKKYGK